MKLWEAWRESFEPGTWLREGRLIRPLRRSEWPDGVVIGQGVTGRIVILDGSADRMFAMPWGATPADMKAEDWEVVL